MADSKPLTQSSMLKFMGSRRTEREGPGPAEGTSAVTSAAKQLPWQPPAKKGRLSVMEKREQAKEYEHNKRERVIQPQWLLDHKWLIAKVSANIWSPGH